MIKCTDCGRFVSYKSIQNGDVKVFYQPSSHFSREIIEHTHKSCINKQ